MTKFHAPLFAFAALTCACGGSSPTTDPGPVDTGAVVDSSGLDEGIDTSTSEDTAPVLDSASGEDGGGTTDQVVRFVAMGDTGKGNTTQSEIGAAIAAKCAKDGCDFVQLLGDNIYESGVTSTTDAQWATKFETPYAAIDLPFYAVLGNHDYGGNGAGNEFGKGKNEVDYTTVSKKWKMPAPHYHHVMKHVEFFALDTNLMMYSMASTQKTEVAGWIAASKTTWKIAVGHHPYYSNGPHGNAGTYEGIPFIPITSGQGVKDFFDSTICGKVDVYFCGHDHSQQMLKPTCKGTELFVSGAGSGNTDLKGSNATYFQAAAPGFLYVRIDGKTLTAEFLDGKGVSEYTRTITKP